jgi:Amt family ammonium transporter
MDACIGGMVFWAWGYAFAYGGEPGAFIGTKYFFGYEMEGQHAAWFFQFAFACTPASIASGSLAERVSIHNYLVFSFCITGFIYPVIVCWTWGGGWLAEMGFTDFAGSGVVHLTGGIAGVVGAAICGPRLGFFDPIRIGGDMETGFSVSPKVVDGYKQVHQKFISKDWDILRVHEFIKSYGNKLDSKSFAAHSPQHAVLGTLLLWIGWLCFNAGSSLALIDPEDGTKIHLSAERAIMNTVLGASAGGLFTFVTRRVITGERKDVRLDFQGLTNGILAGLVCITASCDCVESWAAVLIGIIGSTTYSLGCRGLKAAKIDDPLEAFQVHGCAGTMGCIVLAFFKIDDGIFYGGKSEVDEEGVKSVRGWELLGIQIFGCLMIALWSGVLCGIFFKVSMKLGVMRMSEEAEILGGDLYYFAPMEFDGNPADYDLADICGKIILESAKKLKESDVRG